MHGDSLSRVESALEALRAGKLIILTDDASRENEADLIIAAEKVTHESMALLIRECSGIVCLCLEGDTIKKLGLKPMVEVNQSRLGTAFTVSIEARHGTTTGVSAADRVTTVRAAIASEATAEDVISPGHVFPLRSAAGGVLERRGHTEGSVDLMRLAGLKPASVLCELMNPDGTMARGPQIEAFAQSHSLPIISIDDIVKYREKMKA